MGEVVRINIAPEVDEARVVELCQRYQIQPPDVNRLAEFLGGMMHALSLLQDRFDLVEQANGEDYGQEYRRARAALHHDVSGDFLSMIQQVRG